MIIVVSSCGAKAPHGPIMCYSVSNYNTQLKKLQPQNMRKKLLGGRNRVQHREYAVSAADFSTKYELIFLTLKLIRMQAKTKLPRENPAAALTLVSKINL